MKHDTVVELGKLIADVTRPLPEREQAAAHLARLKDSVVDAIPDDDPDVLELLKPWVQDSPFHVWLAMSWAETTGGRSVNGWSLADAQKHVLERRRAHRRVEAVRDETLPLMERLAVCQVILDDCPDDHDYRRGGYSPAKLMAKINGDGCLDHAYTVR